MSRNRSAQQPRNPGVLQDRIAPVSGETPCGPDPEYDLEFMVLAASVAAADRNAAPGMMREARRWFGEHEPGSPIPVLPGRAEQFVGKRYADVVRAMPANLSWKFELEC